MKLNCPGCGANAGELHQDGCDHEQCSNCGMQYISCVCPDQKTRIPWSWEYPGVAECREFLWFDPATGREDLNRMFELSIWDKEKMRFEL